MQENKLLSYTRLQHHIDVPDLEEVWLDGYESAQAEVAENSNPYQTGTTEYFQWNEGWWSGFYEEAPLFKLADSPAQAVARENIQTTSEVSRQETEFKVWFKRFCQLAGALFVAAICVQLAEMAV